MGVRDGSVRAYRVVAMGSAAESLDGAPSLEVVRAETGYDAAVELLAAPTDALAADLGRLAGEHVGLLRLAREMGVPVVGFGAIPAGTAADVLADVRLVGLRQLAAVIGEVAGVPTKAPDRLPDEKPQQAKAPEAADVEVAPAPRPAGRKHAAGADRAVAEKPPAKPAPKAPVERPAAPRAPARPRTLSESLTREELEALLGGEA